MEHFGTVWNVYPPPPPNKTAPKSLFAILALILLLPLTAHAQTVLKSTFGWGDSFRLGRWNPIFVTLADQQTRSVLLQIHGLYGTDAALEIHQIVAAEPQPKTFCLLYPVNADPSKISVTASDQQTGQTLAWELPQNPGGFYPAGHTPIQVLASDETLIGIAGNISDAMQISDQLKSANLHNGVLTTYQLPACAIGYEGISVLILSAADLHDLDVPQQQSIVDWIHAGGNLVFIPGPDDLPSNNLLLQTLPCDIGSNTTVALPATQPAQLNARKLSPHADAQEIKLHDWTGYTARRGLGRITVLPANVAPMQFDSPAATVTFWRSILTGMVPVPDLKVITNIPVSEELEDVLPQGPNRRDSVGRGPREVFAIRALLAQMDADHPHPSTAFAAAMLALAGLFFLLGPADSILLMRLGQSPRHWLTVVGWLGLLVSIAGYAVAKVPQTQIHLKSVRLIDQIDGVTIAETDLAAIESSAADRLALTLPKNEFWEPANQAALGFSQDRFPDFDCHQDQQGSRPQIIQLAAGEPQSFRGECIANAPALLDLTGFAIHNKHLTGKLTNHSATPISDIVLTTSSGEARLTDAVSPGASVEIDAPLSDTATAQPDWANLAPDRTDKIAALIRTGDWLCVTGQLPQEPGLSLVDGTQTQEHWEMLRAIAPLAK